MRINLESNFMLLGSEDIERIDFETTEVTLKGLLEAISSRSTNNPEFLNKDGTDVTIGWDISINGCPLGESERGVNSVLRDGDKVEINLDLLGGG